MSRSQAIAILCLIWALVYLPGYGTPELKGEEGRRAMPGVTMLQTGEWLVPHIGGEVYLRKPPLVNWVAAGGMVVLGAQTEWAVRLGSVLAMLGLGLTILLTSDRWLKPEGALLAAIFALTNISLLEKGRLVEIEALYIALTGVAVAVWVMLWLRASSSWWLWAVPAVFLGLGMLAKGPLHLLFFYGCVIPVLMRAGRQEVARLWHPGHLLGGAIIVGVFALWALPMLGAAGQEETLEVWRNQFSGRVSGGGFNFTKWLENIPRSVLNYLPWAIFLPMLWNKRALTGLEPRVEAVAYGMRWGVVVTFAVITLLPGSVPRYTLPLITPVSLLLALVFVSGGGAALPGSGLSVWRWILMVLAVLGSALALAIPFVAGWEPWRVVLAMGTVFLAIALVMVIRVLRRAESLAVATGGVIAVMMVVYGLGVAPRVTAFEDLRPAAAQVNSQVGEDELLGVYRPGYQPVVFYLDSGFEYLLGTKELTARFDWLLVREKHLGRIRQDSDWAQANDVLQIDGRSGKAMHLLQR